MVFLAFLCFSKAFHGLSYFFAMVFSDFRRWRLRRLALLCGNFEAAASLLVHRARTDLKNWRGKTALDLAEEQLGHVVYPVIESLKRLYQMTLTT